MAAAVQPLAAESADELSEFLRDIMSLSLFDGGSSYWAEARNIDVSGVGPSDLVSFDIALIAAVLDAYVDRAVTEKEADSYPDGVVDMSAAADILAQYMKGDTK